MEWRIEVPSAGRASTLARKTLPWLRSMGVPRERIRLWVPEAETSRYWSACPGYELVGLSYDPAARGDDLDAGPYGLGIARNAIIDAASTGDRVVQVDDDLDGLVQYAGMKDSVNARLVPVDDFLGLVDVAWQVAEDAGAYLWGCHPAATYARPKTRVGLCYIGGGLFGIHARSRPSVEHVVLDDKEDFERSVRFYEADGRLARLDGVSWRTRGYGGSGGMQTTRTPERIDASARWVAARWPEFATLKFPRSGKTELRLADRRRVA